MNGTNKSEFKHSMPIANLENDARKAMGLDSPTTRYDWICYAQPKFLPAALGHIHEWPAKQTKQTFASCYFTDLRSELFRNCFFFWCESHDVFTAHCLHSPDITPAIVAQKDHHRPWNDVQRKATATATYQLIWSNLHVVNCSEHEMQKLQGRHERPGGIQRMCLPTQGYSCVFICSFLLIFMTHNL